MDKAQAVLLGVSTASGFATGTLLGYIVAHKRSEKEFEARIDDEIKKMETHYAKLYKTDEFETVEKAAEVLLPTVDVQTLEQRLEDYQTAKYQKLIKPYGSSAEEAATQTAEIVKNIFDNDDEWDWEQEEAARAENPKIYVLHVEEYNQNEWDCDVVSLTYYDGDGVLADERDQLVDDVEGSIGSIALSSFGHGSKDANVVYIRNDTRDVLFEVIRHETSYTETVMGMELEHSYKRPPRKFRDIDE